MQKPFLDFEWKTLPRGDVAPHWSGLYVSLSRKGAITISRVTHERLGSPSAYLIRLDAVNQRLALEPSVIGKRNAYPARVIGRRGAKVIRAHRILTQWNITRPTRSNSNAQRSTATAGSSLTSPTP